MSFPKVVAAGVATVGVVYACRRLLTSRSAPQLTLYGSSRYRSFRNVWMLEEMGVLFEHVPAKPRTAEANAVNPFGKIPTLIDGHVNVFESVAINTYLGDKYRWLPQCSQLVPLAGTDARARYEVLTCCLLAELDAQGLWIHRKHGSDVAQYIGSMNADAVAVAKAHCEKIFHVMAKELLSSGGDYMLGEHFSAVDILFVHCLNWGESIGWGDRWTSPAADDEPMCALAAYLGRCRARPAYARAKARP